MRILIDGCELDAEDVIYHEAGWSWGGPLGGKMGPRKEPARWQYLDYFISQPDVRWIPPEAQLVLDDYDRQIVALHEARRAYREEHFREWPVVKTDEVRVVPGTTKAEVVQEHARR